MKKTTTADFFDQPKEKSKIKVYIVTEFFKTYFSIINRRGFSDEIYYIDLFSGPGVYKDGTRSTPMVLMDIVDSFKDDDIRNKLVMLFNDENAEYYNTLNQQVAQHPVYGEGIAEFIDEAIKAFCGVKQMIREVMHDPIFLAGKSEIATKDDLQVAQDLLDTLMAHRESCVGMAANMIGMRKRIIAFLNESGRAPTYMVMLNPEIIKKDGAYSAEEGCLSLLGGPRPCKRYKSIKVKYQTLDLQTRIKTYTGWTAQIIQHEVDHCEGVLI